MRRATRVSIALAALAGAAIVWSTIPPRRPAPSGDDRSRLAVGAVVEIRTPDQSPVLVETPTHGHTIPTGSRVVVRLDPAREGTALDPSRPIRVDVLDGRAEGETLQVPRQFLREPPTADR